MKVINRTSMIAERFAKAASHLPAHENLQQLMQWALGDRTGSFIPGVVLKLIVQDEFSHDVIVPWQDGLVLVYDTT